MEGNIFGIDSEITNSHMIKNSEWGAVAYLSQSKYGKYGNDSYEGANKEVYQNKSSSYTGNSNGTPSQNEANEQYVYNDASNNLGNFTVGQGTAISMFELKTMADTTVDSIIINQDSSTFISNFGFIKHIFK